MFNIKDYIKNYIIIILLTFLATISVMLYLSNNKITSLENDMVKIEKKLSLEESNNSTLKAGLEHQSKEVEKWKTEKEDVSAEYIKLMSIPEKVRFQTKYVEVKSNDCSSIKLILDDIRTTGF